MRVVKNKISNLRDINKGVKTSIQGQFTYTNLNNLDKRFWKKNDFEKGLKNIRFNISEISKISKKINAEFLLLSIHGQKLYIMVKNILIGLIC